MEHIRLTLKPHRRPVHRPAFDILECRILPAIPVVQYPLPDGNVYPVSLAFDGEGNLWFNIKGGDEIDRIAPDGTLSRIPLGPPTDPTQGQPLDTIFNSLTLGPDGNIWVNGLRTVDRVTPDGVVTSFDLGQPPNLLPVGDFPSAITAGPDGALWFADLDGSIGRITTDGAVTLYPLPDANDQSSSITAGPDGALWFTAGKDIGRITTDGSIEVFPSANGAYVNDIAAGPDGNLWFVADQGDQIGRISTDGQQEYFTLPTPSARPTSLKVGPDGALWFVEQQAGQIGRITTDGVIGEYPLPGNPTSPDSWGNYPIEIAFGADGSLWYATGLITLEAGSTDPVTGGQSLTIVRTHEIDRIDASDVAAIVAPAAPIPGPGPASHDSATPPAAPTGNSPTPGVAPADGPSTPPVLPAPASASQPGPETGGAGAKAAGGGTGSTPDGAGQLPLVFPNPPATSSANASSPVASTAHAPSATEAETTSSPANRAGKPVPTVGLAPSKLPGSRRAPKPVPKPSRIARVSPPEITASIVPPPAAHLEVSAPLIGLDSTQYR